MDREQMQRCLDVVAAYRASGQKGKAWAQANGVPERTLASWCAHARRLQSGGFAWPREDTGCLVLSREQFDWLVAGLPWQRLGAPPGRAITAV